MQARANNVRAQKKSLSPPMNNVKWTTNLQQDCNLTGKNWLIGYALA